MKAVSLVEELGAEDLFCWFGFVGELTGTLAAVIANIGCNFVSINSFSDSIIHSSNIIMFEFA